MSHPSMAQRQQRELKAVQDLVNLSSSSTEVPPSQLDQRTKVCQQAAARAVKLSNKCTALVSSDQAKYGLDPFSNALQQSQATEMRNEVDTHHMPTTSKKPRAAIRFATLPATPAPTIPAPMPTLPPDVPQLKCQGCVHCDLLELAALEQRYVPTYLKDNAFLAAATCAGECNQVLKDICAAAPHDSIHYCDTGKKGFDVPDDDELKSSMECGLVLCLPCYEKRRVEYETETGAAKGGRRIGRRSNKRK
jgi:hypothetical protein